MLVEWMEEREGVSQDEETQELMQRVMEQVLRDDGIEMEVVVGVTFVDPERIREINRAFRGIDSVTDVLSFPMIEGMLHDATPSSLLGCVDPETGALELGDLVICVDSARRELGYLSAHGMLHLLGYDHETEEERAQMRTREEEALKKCALTRED